MSKNPDDVRIKVTFLRAFDEKLAGKYDVELTEAVAKAKTKFAKFAPMVEKLEKLCRQENSASLAIVLAGEINYGMESEAMMEECLDNARTIIEDWITVSNFVSGNSDKK